MAINQTIQNRRLQAIASAPEGSTIGQIAAHVGVSRSTITRILSRPDARETINRIRSEQPFTPAPLPDTEALQDEIMRELRGIGTDKGTPSYARVSALGKLAELLRAKRDDEEFEKRLSELETLAERKGLL